MVVYSKLTDRVGVGICGCPMPVCTMPSTADVLAQLPVVTLLASDLKLVTHKATACVHAGELPMATTSEKCQRDRTARRHRMATDTEIRRVARGTVEVHTLRSAAPFRIHVHDMRKPR